MLVTCKKPNKYTVKGVTYKVLFLNNKKDPSSRWFYPRIMVEIKPGITSTYSPKNFTMTDGTPIPEINYQSTEYNPESWRDGYISEENMVKKGDYVVYRYGSSKLMEKGKTYKVEDVRVTRHKSTSSTWVNITIKIEKNPRWISSTSFRKLSDQESRDISLSELLDQPVPVSEIDKSTRKFDRMNKDDQHRILLSTLASAMIDVTRNNMSIIEWACEKIGKKYDLKPDDFKPILKKSLNTLIKERE